MYPIRCFITATNVNEDLARLKHERRLRILEKEIQETLETRFIITISPSPFSPAPDYEKAATEAMLAIDLAEKAGEAESFFYAWTHYVAASALSTPDGWKRLKNMSASRPPLSG